MAVDALVASVSAYNPRPIWAHMYVGPFVLLYLAWAYLWVCVYGFNDHVEVGSIVMAAIALLQVLVVLFCHWFVGVRCLLTSTAVADPTRARVVKVVPMPNNGWAEVVPLHKSKMTNGKTKLWFEFQKVHYIYDEEEKKQFRAVEFSTDRPIEFYQESKGLETEQLIQEAMDEYGDNHMEMAVPQFMELFKERATAPFFVFQVFCVGLWCLDEMWYYSVFTLAMLVTFEATLVRQQLRNMQEIRNMGNKPYLIHAYRNKRWNRIKTDELLPGDIVSICRSPDEQAIPCDLLLLRGPCIVDESMLTGESVPQMKEPIQELERGRYFDMDSDSRLHVLSGGTRVVQHTSPAKNEPGLKAPDNGCICYVLRTGFNTSQGKLLRTIMFGVKRVTANNLETFGFILFLLIFAIAASAYVWIKGSEDESRNKYKLFLECTLILTSVVPPELPIELSLAVNSSLMALQKLGVFCTEPFRIPFAGKINVCCFDKTGTLTTDNLVVEGIAGIVGTSVGVIKSSPADVPSESIQVLVTCHSLVKLDDDLVGDPLEQACLTWAEWNLTKNDAVVPQKGKMIPLKVHHRFHFSSAMKRMTVIAGYIVPGTSDARHIVCVKGAPETLKDMFASVPKDYDETYQQLTRQGARVLALGTKEIGSLSYQEIRETKREDVEKGLNFAGFVVISCPLKVDSKAMIKEIIDSSHRVVMITGDNALTACHVAKVLRFTRKSMETLILDQNEDNEWNWVSVDGSKVLPMLPGKSEKAFLNEYEFCLTGPAFAYLLTNEYQFLKKLLMRVKVFARMAPKQKERIITEMKSLGHVTLMCGDGTNDVGALKHAHVGVALLSHPFDPNHGSGHTPSSVASPPSDKNGSAPPDQPTNQGRRRGPLPAASAVARRQDAPIGARQRPAPGAQVANKKLEQLMKQMEEEEKAQVVRLGDASIAAPFASKISSIQSICHVIKQGRCTLVTTLQMFKILALNALVLAYGQSVLYLDGIKFSDTQATIQGLLLAACFLFVSRSKPLRTLSKQRPITNIFNVYTLLTVTGQFCVHFGCLLYLVQEAHVLEPKPEKIDLATAFKPSLLNTTVYIMSVALQVSTFAVNYRGRPFMESLWENKAMLYSVLFSGGSIFLLAAGVMPEMSEKFELVAIPTEFRNIVLAVLAFDLVSCYIIDRILNFVCGDARA